MQKATKDLFLKLKAVRPGIHAISDYYGMDWHDDRLVQKYWLEYPNKHIEFHTEKELQDEMTKMILDTNSDLGFRFPETTSKLKIKDGLPDNTKTSRVKQRTKL